MNMGSTLSLFGGYLYVLPLFLVWLIGIVFAIATWKKHPTVSALATIGLAIILISGLFGTYLNTLVFGLRQGSMTLEKFGILNTVISITRLMMTETGWVLILIAIFKNR